MRSRGPVIETRIALGVEPVDPTMGALTRDPHRFRDVSNRSAIIDDPSDQQATTVNSETSITVRHEDLLVSEDGTSPLSPEVLHVHKPHVTNVPAEYS